MDEAQNRNRVWPALEEELKNDRRSIEIRQSTALSRRHHPQARSSSHSSSTLDTANICTEPASVKSPRHSARIYIEMRKMQKHLDRGDVS